MPTYDMWEEVDSSYLTPFILPEGVTENCRVRDSTKDSFYYLFIGTNDGVYAVMVCPNGLASRKCLEARPAGLKGKNIVELRTEKTGRDCYVLAVDEGERVFKTKDHLLTGSH